MYFHFWNSPYQCDALVYSLAYSLAYWLSLCVCMLCMHVSVQFNNQLLNAYFECLTYLHLQLFVRLVLCIDYSIVALFVTCNTYMQKPSVTYTHLHIHTHTSGLRQRKYIRNTASLHRKAVFSVVCVRCFFTTKYLCMKFC